MPPLSPADVGVLVSGGLDSCILLATLLREGRTVQPFYVRTGVRWEMAERQALRAFLEKLPPERLRPLVELLFPLGDLYEGHWSLTGQRVPADDSPDEAVFLPGRNASLLIKPLIWCQLHQIGELAIAPLGTSPFEDAGEKFLHEFEHALNRGSSHAVRLLRPFGRMTKQDVMRLGGDLPLEWTFSCINPRRNLHCGACNKCAERRQAFALAGIADATRYAHDATLSTND